MVTSSAPPQPERDAEKNLPQFNRFDKDQMGLGHTPSTRSAELVAGARAYLMHTPETTALSRPSGTITARLLTNLGGTDLNVLWFFPARMMAIETLTEQLVPKQKADLLLVDLAAGFSPRGLHLARNYPNSEVIEIDLPQVVTDKKRRLKNADIKIPANLRWIEADLGATDLQAALGGRKADLITSEGLTLYLTPKEQHRLFSQVAANLADDSVFITEVYFQSKLDHLRQQRKINSVASFVIRLVGKLPGMMPDPETCRKRLTEAGLSNLEEYAVVDMMEKIGQPKPVDVISIMVARKSTAGVPQSTVKTEVVPKLSTSTGK
jgi:O-methyltransferase involved in polyketide biosynthesis